VALPFAISFMAAGLILSRTALRVPETRIFLNPLLLAGLYGLVGLIAIWKSPDSSLAFRWVFLYLSVPLVLWAVVSGTDPLGHLQRLINFNWLVIILAVMGLFALALLKLELATVFLNPSEFLDCSYGGWYDLTSGQLRDTGVGRYAAIAAIIALSGLWRPRWRPVWLFVLLTSGALLLFTGARGSFGGFVPGAGLVVLANGGKKAFIAGAAVILLLTPLVWSTGAHWTFVNNCIFPGLIPMPEKGAQPNLAGLENTVIATQVAEALPETTPETHIAATQSPKNRPEAIISNSEAPPPIPTREAVLEQPPQAASTAAALAPLPVTKRPKELSKEQSKEPAPTSLPTPPDPTAQSVSPPPDPTPQGVSPPPDPTPQSVPPPPELLFGVVPKSFFKFTGRTAVWVDGLRLLKESPVIGYGFNADRLLLNTHMHNSLMQALIQTGLLGTLLFISAILMGWVLLLKILLNLGRLPSEQKYLVIQAGGILAFLTVRSFPESTGAFFGVDWLILAPILLYLYTVNFPRRKPKTRQIRS